MQTLEGILKALLHTDGWESTADGYMLSMGEYAVEIIRGEVDAPGGIGQTIEYFNMIFIDDHSRRHRIASIYPHNQYHALTTQVFYYASDNASSTAPAIYLEMLADALEIMKFTCGD